MPGFKLVTEPSIPSSEIRLTVALGIDRILLVAFGLLQKDRMKIFDYTQMMYFQAKFLEGFKPIILVSLEKRRLSSFIFICLKKYPCKYSSILG